MGGLTDWSWGRGIGRREEGRRVGMAVGDAEYMDVVALVGGLPLRA